MLLKSKILTINRFYVVKLRTSYAFKIFDLVAMRSQKAHTALWFYVVKLQAHAFKIYAQQGIMAAHRISLAEF